jgi:hypothetical protein
MLLLVLEVREICCNFIKQFEYKIFYIFWQSLLKKSGIEEGKLELLNICNPQDTLCLLLNQQREKKSN